MSEKFTEEQIQDAHQKIANLTKWFNMNDKPIPNTELVIKLENNKLIDAVYIDDYNRPGLRFRGTGNLFWLNFNIPKMICWRYRNSDEPLRRFEEDK